MSATENQASGPYCYPYPHPAVTTDVVVFTIREAASAAPAHPPRRRAIRGHWALPGGFLDIDEDLERLRHTGAGGRDRRRAASISSSSIPSAVPDATRGSGSSASPTTPWCPRKARPASPRATPPRRPGSRSRTCRLWPSITTRSSAPPTSAWWRSSTTPPSRSSSCRHLHPERAAGDLRDPGGRRARQAQLPQMGPGAGADRGDRGAAQARTAPSGQRSTGSSTATGSTSSADPEKP